MTQKLDYLIDSLRLNLKKIKDTFPGMKIGFMLGSTVGSDHNDFPYSTPIRRYELEVIFGAIVFKQADAIVLAFLFADSVDKFYVDIEKKLLIDPNPDYSMLEKYGIPSENIPKKLQPELGNISKAIRAYVENEKIIAYKANDLTVEAVWSFVVSHFQELSGKKGVIVGLGNIGSKLCLKLVESGCDIKVFSRNSVHDKMIVDGLNEIKNKAALASISLTRTIEFELLSADFIVLTASSKAVLSEYQIKYCNKCTLIVDVGKGNLDQSALECAINKNISVWRADITAYLPIALSQHKSLSQEYREKFGRSNSGELNLVSGGFIGLKYDLVVDNFMKPTLFYGVCDGHGGFLPPSNEITKEQLKKFNILIEKGLQ